MTYDDFNSRKAKIFRDEVRFSFSSNEHVVVNKKIGRGYGSTTTHLITLLELCSSQPTEACILVKYFTTETTVHQFVFYLLKNNVTSGINYRTGNRYNFQLIDKNGTQFTSSILVRYSTVLNIMGIRGDVLLVLDANNQCDISELMPKFNKIVVEKEIL